MNTGTNKVMVYLTSIAKMEDFFPHFFSLLKKSLMDMIAFKFSAYQFSPFIHNNIDKLNEIVRKIEEMKHELYIERKIDRLNIY